MRLTLNIERDEYIGMFSPSVGARITVHPREEKPFPEDKGFNVAPGFETNVAVAMVSLVPDRGPVCVLKVSPKFGCIYQN